MKEKWWQKVKFYIRFMEDYIRALLAKLLAFFLKNVLPILASLLKPDLAGGLPVLLR